mmetsp:Transcript_14488/g.33725  ORF Transcript_14488/g.33725 Transcript_14488/m.33725 type:complete len:397 (-) Transcript_14488:157-1347(-)
MRFITKKRPEIDDTFDDAEGASDIISQEESSYGRIGSSLNNKNDVSRAAPTEWSDPWSSDPWKNVTWGDSFLSDPSRIESSFESLQFTPVLKTTGEESDIMEFADAFGMPFGPVDVPTTDGIGTSGSHSKLTSIRSLMKGEKISVGVLVKERLSLVFDETTDDPTCKIVGSIFAKPTKRNISSFSLTIRDSRAHVEHWDERSSRCRNITASVPHLALDPGDQVFSISLNNRDDQHNLGLDAPVVRYTCNPRLRPIPMLLKTKSHRKNNRCQLGVRIRANPQNKYVLTDIFILIVVPPDLDGENITMSRKGGVWDEMKRTLVWKISKLEPGEIIDMQSQFQSNMEGGSNESKFPLLAKCNGDTSFSKIDLNTDYTEDGVSPVHIDLERVATILYRKL